MRPTHLFAHDKSLTASEFAIYGCAWADGPMFASPKGAPSEFSLSLVGDTTFAPLTLSSPGTTSTITDPVIGSVGDVIEVSGDRRPVRVQSRRRPDLHRSRSAAPAPRRSQDPFLALRDNTLAILNLDDDGGDGINSLSPSPPPIPASTSSTLGLSGLRPDRRTIRSTSSRMTALDESDYLRDADRADARRHHYGFIDSAATGPYGPPFGEVDTFSITVEAGKVYTIEVAGGADYTSDFPTLPPGELDPVIVVYGPDLSTRRAQRRHQLPRRHQLAGQLPRRGERHLLSRRLLLRSPGPAAIRSPLEELDPADFNPLDSINWFSADKIDIPPDGIVKVYFGAPGESFGEPPTTASTRCLRSAGTPSRSSRCSTRSRNIPRSSASHYVGDDQRRRCRVPADHDDVDPVRRLFLSAGSGLRRRSRASARSTSTAAAGIFRASSSLQQGGFSFAVILHEFGHAHGLAHPHDNGGGSDVMLGVTGPFDSYGIFDLNQGVYTVMSYNDAWHLHPDGPSPFTGGNGRQWLVGHAERVRHRRAPGALRRPTPMRPATTSTRSRTSMPRAPTTRRSGTPAAPTRSAIPALATRGSTSPRRRSITSPTGGGVVSFVDDIFGGYTIANGVVIENATGGDGDDMLIGNAVANVLNGNGGDDFLMGGAGGDNAPGRLPASTRPAT